MNIEHIGIWTRDIRRVADFYSRYFGMVVGEEYRNPKAGFTSVFLTAEGGRLELMHREGIAEHDPTERFGLAHIAIGMGSTERVDELTIKIEKEGYEVISRPRKTGDGYYESVVLDPEGNRVEITDS